jgi:hypothetical protein
MENGLRRSRNNHDIPLGERRQGSHQGQQDLKAGLFCAPYHQPSQIRVGLCGVGRPQD